MLPDSVISEFYSSIILAPERKHKPTPGPIFILEDGDYAGTLPRMTQAGEVVVYSRKGCHLCEIVKESLVKLHKRGGFTWREIDVDSNAEVRRLYNDEVPVVFINGRKAFKYRMDEQEFLRKLSA
jgi:glutaredoxin